MHSHGTDDLTNFSKTLPTVRTIFKWRDCRLTSTGDANGVREKYLGQENRNKSNEERGNGKHALAEKIG
jgi:hypothetical protein